MNRYTKLPVTIEASDPIDADNVEAIAAWCGGRVSRTEKPSDPTDVAVWIDVPTLEGTMRGSLGHRIIRGVKGEFYPCNPTIFDATYEAEAGHGWGWAREDRTLWHLPVKPGTESDDGPLDGPLVETDARQANMVGSLLDNGRHSPVLDLDFEARLVPSSTPGHYHLFLDGLELDADAYDALADALVAAKVIQPGFRRRLRESGTTLARLRRDKTPGEPATGPIVVTTPPGDVERF